ncbi:MATE family efflux transporter [Allonocardiopsis opalescens]|uniref:Putative MATE family efflux protein n=1 Tax=Allonocardiopsis opalescens TaxID=1144618 RepID=A0A2T0Q6T8_9ACTN|nr:MATE family efflux transporter [Allonocardiopsis opalescens]PRX99538.1 putative MATE family efflux protein [Allonocardiopsis opalescens]
MRVSLPAAPFRHRHDREILSLAIPAFFALVAEPLFLLVDSAVVGRLGTEPLAALGVAGQILLTVTGLCVFLAYGTTPAVARQVGAGDLAAAVRHGVDGLWLAFLIGCGTALLGWPLAPWLVEAMGASAAVTPHAVVYLRVSLLGMPGMLLVLAGTGVLRGLQDTRTPLAVAVGSYLLNGVLVVWFVLGLGGGIAGSAWAGVVAQTLAGGVYVAMVLRLTRRHGVGVLTSPRRLRAATAASTALLVRNIAMRVVVMVCVAVAARLGDPTLAAHQVAFQVWGLLVFAMDAIAIAGQAIIGRYLGAGDSAGARAATRRMVEWGVAAGVVFAVAVLAARPWIPPLFSTDPQVRELMLVALVMVAALQPLSGIVMVLDGVLIGAGDLRYLAWASVWTMLAFLPPGLAVLAFGRPGTAAALVGLWLAYGVWLVARGITLGLRARGRAWAVIGAVR